MDIERGARQIQSLTGLIGIVGGLLAAVAAFNQQLRDALAVVAPLGVAGLIGAAVVLIVIGTALFAAGRRRASRLVDPDALRLSSRNPEHLVGRGEDIRLLREKCVARALVFLVGDSGSGKSALVQAGLAPAACNESHFLPAYIDMADLDWEMGPLAALADHFWHALTDDDRKKLGTEKPPARDNIKELLARCYDVIGKRPLVILDQIDDYQLRHRARFLPPQTRSWISAHELATQNKFWATIAQLTEARQVHAIFVTRSDNADGLESLRFSPEPLVSRLDPLPPGFALRVVDQLTLRPAGAAPVIEAPELGWDRLRIRLADDLEHAGSVLPQQLKLTLLGLARLKALSVVRYERAGGVEGLEARYIEDALLRAATRAGLPVSALRAVILRLVERDGPRRAAALSTMDLASTLGDRDRARLAPALEALEEAEILRRRETEGATAWQLDHDYLARGLLHIEANADRWKGMLIRRAREFEDAKGDWRARRRALLGLREQLGLLVARLFGRFRYGEQRGFAVLCTIPYAAIGVLLAAIAAVGYGAVEVFRSEAALATLVPDELLSPVEYQALGHIAMMDDFSRAYFGARLMADPNYARSAAEKPHPIARALVGLDEDRAEWMADWLIVPNLEEGDVASVRAAAGLLAQLPPRMLGRLQFMPGGQGNTAGGGRTLEDHMVFVVAANRPDISSATQRIQNALQRLKESRGKIGAQADGARNYAAGDILFASREVPVEYLSATLASVRDELRESYGYGPAVSSLVRLYAVVGQRLPPADRGQVVADLIAGMRAHRGTAASIQPFATALLVATRTLPEEHGRSFLRPLAEEFAAAHGDPNSLIPIAFVLSAVAPPLAPERSAAARALRDEVNVTRGAGMIVGWLAEAHATLSIAQPADLVGRTDVLTAVVNELSERWARSGTTPQFGGPGGLVRYFFESCWLNDCFALFACTVLDRAAPLPLEAKAALVVELLKVPAATRLNLTEGLLARLRAEPDAKAAGVPAGGIWEFAAWADAQGLEPDRPLDMARLFDALPQ